MKKLQAFLSGKKTYILGLLMVLTSVEKYFTGDITLSQFLTTVQGVVGFNGLGVMTLRAAVAKVTPNTAVVHTPATTSGLPPEANL